MATKASQKNSKTNKKLEIKYHKPTESETVFLPSDHPSFISRLQQIYDLATSTIEARHVSKWAKCCRTMEKHGRVGQLGHPADQCQDFKMILQWNNIQNEEQFIVFMKNELPTRENGDFQLPQINMRHPGANNQLENQPEDPEPANLGIPEEPAHNFELKREEQYRAVAEQNEKLSQAVADLKREINSTKVV